MSTLPSLFVAWWHSNYRDEMDSCWSRKSVQVYQIISFDMRIGTPPDSLEYEEEKRGRETARLGELEERASEKERDCLPVPRSSSAVRCRNIRQRLQVCRRPTLFFWLLLMLSSPPPHPPCFLLRGCCCWYRRSRTWRCFRRGQLRNSCVWRLYGRAYACACLAKQSQTCNGSKLPSLLASLPIPEVPKAGKARGACVGSSTSRKSRRCLHIQK